MLQIVFNKISAAEISQLSTLEQLQVFDEFQVTEASLQQLDGNIFGKLETKNKLLYRFKEGNYRIYFEVIDDKVVVHRVLHKNSFKDFLFRTNLSTSEDEQLSTSKSFWQLIEEGEKAQRQN